MPAEHFMFDYLCGANGEPSCDAKQFVFIIILIKTPAKYTTLQSHHTDIWFYMQSLFLTSDLVTS